MDRFIDLLRGAVGELHEARAGQVITGQKVKEYHRSVGYLAALRDVLAEIEIVRKRILGD